jgi:uncharacterized protein YecA (UPF0149 family)
MDNEQLKATVKQYMHDLFGGKKPPHKRSEPKIGRNQPCPCGSSRKYKYCCMNKKQ